MWIMVCESGRRIGVCGQFIIRSELQLFSVFLASQPDSPSPITFIHAGIFHSLQQSHSTSPSALCVRITSIPLRIRLYNPTSTKMVNISEVKGNARENRTSAHTHIKGLGLRPDGTAETTGNGFVGQVAAREVCGFLVLKADLHDSDNETGLRRGRGLDKSQKDVGQGSAISRRARDG